jgi:hypothetical protein
LTKKKRERALKSVGLSALQGKGVSLHVNRLDNLEEVGKFMGKKLTKTGSR